ncbi:hypothetical protein [Calothrix sp. NIES-2098]
MIEELNINSEISCRYYKLLDLLVIKQIKSIIGDRLPLQQAACT